MTVQAWAFSDSPDYLSGFFYLGAVPVGSSLVGVINYSADVPIMVSAVCRSDYGRDFFDLPEPLRVSPGRTVWIDIAALPQRYHIDRRLNYRLVSSHSMWSPDGLTWYFGTEEESYGPIIPDVAIGDL